MKKFIAKASAKLGLTHKKDIPAETPPDAPVDTTKTREDGRAYFNDGRISFKAPEGFGFLSDDMIAPKYGTDGRPDAVLSNENATATIACTIRPEDMSVAPIDEIRHAISRSFEQSVPQIRWYRNTILNIDNREWFYAEFSSNQPDAYLYNMILMTAYEGQTLAFNFNSIMGEKENYKAIYYESMKSMKVS
jgi:hypothetical protein